MEKVVHIIMGAIGTGKSFLANILSKKYGLPILSADQIEYDNKGGDDIESLIVENFFDCLDTCLLYTSPSPRDKRQSRMPSSA